jgi:RNA polymerase sigma factor (sigma-70 family)
LQNHTASEDRVEWLVERAAGGDAAAFGELYDIHIDLIYRHIYYRVGNTGDAEDLTQQVFINAWKAIGRFRKKSSPFAAWLMTISRNLLIDFYRARKDKVSLDDDYDKVSDEPGPEQAAERISERRGAAEERRGRARHTAPGPEKDARPAGRREWP